MFDLKNTPDKIQNGNATLRIRAAEGETPELLIMDDIGESWEGGIKAVDVRSFLGDNPGKVTARFNSYGGDAFEGIVIHNAFQEHGNVEAVVDGIAYSAASIAALGAKKLTMKEASSFGVHYAWTVVAGNRKDLKAADEWLANVDSHIVSTLQNKSGADEDQANKWLAGTSDGTIFTAAEALEAGLIDEVIPLKKPKEEKPNDHAKHAIALQQKRLRAKLAAR